MVVSHPGVAINWNGSCKRIPIAKFSIRRRAVVWISRTCRCDPPPATRQMESD
jgi:hypothetical protein